MPSVHAVGVARAREGFHPVTDTDRAAALHAPEIRLDGPGKVRGSTRYVTDLRPARLLHVAYVTSPIAHGIVRRVDTSRASATPGVVAIVIGRDAAPTRIGRRLQDWPVLAWDRVRFVG